MGYSADSIFLSELSQQKFVGYSIFLVVNISMMFAGCILTKMSYTDKSGIWFFVDFNVIISKNIN